MLSIVGITIYRHVKKHNKTKSSHLMTHKKNRFLSNRVTLENKELFLWNLCYNSGFRILKRDKRCCVRKPASVECRFMKFYSQSFGIVSKSIA